MTVHSIRILSLLCGGLLLAGGVSAAQDELVLPSPVAADFKTLLAHRSDVLTVFSYENRRNITVLDFPTLAIQGRMFNRLVALIERIGAPRERVLGNDELARFIRSTGKTEATLAYGNDFLVAELVIFFNLADLGNVDLNPEELALRQFLLTQRLMVMRNGFYQSLIPAAVILSLPQERPADANLPPVTALARQTILAHEIAHAEYYSNPVYANYCRHFWHSVMQESEREAFKKFLARSGYNPENQEMMINETQAYLMHTPDARAFSPSLVGLGDTVIQLLRRKFRSGFPSMAYTNP